jgi:hypothetical protein
MTENYDIAVGLRTIAAKWEADADRFAVEEQVTA